MNVKSILFTEILKKVDAVTIQNLLDNRTQERLPGICLHKIMPQEVQIPETSDFKVNKKLTEEYMICR